MADHFWYFLSLSLISFFFFLHFGKRLLERCIRGELALALLLYDIWKKSRKKTYQLSIVSVLKPSHRKYKRRNWPLLKTIISTFKIKWGEVQYYIFIWLIPTYNHIFSSLCLCLSVCTLCTAVYNICWLIFLSWKMCLKNNSAVVQKLLKTRFFWSNVQSLCTASRKQCAWPLTTLRPTHHEAQMTVFAMQRGCWIGKWRLCCSETSKDSVWA